MKIALFYHSLVSDWNHGNAHFLRGVASELAVRGHDVNIYEPRNGWSKRNLTEQHGIGPMEAFSNVYPRLKSIEYDEAVLDLDEELDGVDLVIVHEWNGADLVRRIGEHRRRSAKNYALLFHDTHHRSITMPQEMEAYDLGGYDGVLAFGRVVRDIYLKRRWTRRAWIWHEAADVRVFKPMETPIVEGDVVWIGNWGDDERTEEIDEFLLEPIRRLRLRAAVYGVRYPEAARKALLSSGIRYHGWLPNYMVPTVFSRFALTIHIPRRPYTASLPGIPTIRPFEAMACGIPLISAPWDDAEHLFEPGKDFLMARNGREMQDHIRNLLADPAAAAELAARGRATIMKRHTCAHRVEELMAICAELGVRRTEAAAA
jgi:spore maturation protein CgeB